MAEHHVPRVRMPVEAQALHDQAVEVAGQVGGQEEGADLVLDQGVESLLARKEGVAMGAGDAFHPFFRADPVDAAAGAAIGVEHKDPVITLAASRADAPAQPVGNALRPVVQDRRQAGDGEVVETAGPRSEEHTSELQSLMRISYAVFCLKKKKIINTTSKCQT